MAGMEGNNMGLRTERVMIKKFNKAMIILYKEQKRRSKLPIRSFSYINEIKFMRKFLRDLYKRIALFKNTDGKYPVLISEEQWEQIKDNWALGEQALSEDNFKNLENQIKALKGE